ncbi:MAG: hypothetical protein J1E07_04700 [Treponema sp.]|nr:hypothetical protein [Treponema sp.]
MKKMIKIVAALAVMLCSGSAFAKGMTMYGKITGGFDARTGNLGVSTDNYDSTTSFGFSSFVVTPTFGMLFAPDSSNGFLRGLGLEASFGVGIGGGSEVIVSSNPISTGSLTLIPRVDAVWHLLTNGAKFGEQKFVMHFMTGFELPIFIPLSSTVEVEIYKNGETRTQKYRLAPWVMSTLNVGAGFDLKLTDKLDLVADISVGIILFNINAGIVYRFK